MNSKSGARPLHDMIEIIFVVIILALMGITTYTLVVVSADSYSRSNDEINAASDLRVASSFISNRLYGAQSPGAVSLRDSGGGTAIVLTEDDWGSAYETWIYFHEGALWEAYISAEDAFDPGLGFEIARLGAFEVTMDGGLVTVTISPAAADGQDAAPVTFAVALRGNR